MQSPSFASQTAMPMSRFKSHIPRQPTAAYPNHPAERARRSAVKLRWSSRLIHCIRAPQHCNALRPPSNVISLGQSAALTAAHSISTIHLKSTNLYRQTSHFVRGIAERSNSSAASHAQSSAPSQRNFRSFRAQKKKPAAADELHMLKTGLEPVRIAPRDFKSPASAISPLQPILFYVMRREIIPRRPIRSSIVPAYAAHAVKGSAASEKSAAAVKSPACPTGVSRSAQACCVLSSPSPQPFRQLIEPANILCRDHDRPVQNRLLLP